MTKFRVTKPGNVLTLVKRIMYLAWQASGVYGMGVFSDRGPQEEDTIWARMYEKTDYPGGNFLGENKPGSVYADYVNGRMMKLGVKWQGDVIIDRDGQWTRDYQSFCGTYPDFENLLKAAAKSLDYKVEKLEGSLTS